jgi:translation initiation factor 1
MSDNSRLVYSTESGSICPSCGRPTKNCSCRVKKPKSHAQVHSDGIIRISREKKGRKGKTVTVITGFDSANDDLKQIAKNLKGKCGSGGSIKDGVIVIQGDHRQAIQGELQRQGFKVKLAGG